MNARKNNSRPVGPLLVDALIAVLVALWLKGGIFWHGREILRHGADPRRAAILVVLVAAWAWPAFRERSVWVWGARAFWAWLETRRGRWIALACGFVLASAIGVLQALALRVPMYDVGIFHQILWSLAHGHGFTSTISGAGNFLLDHLAPSLAVLTPAYWASGSSPLILQILHPALIFMGVAAWVWLAESLGARPWLAAAAALFGLVFDSLWGNLYWGFHENSIAFAALSWAFALIFAGAARTWRRRLGIVALFMVAAGSKEIVLVDVAFALGVWASVERKRSHWFCAACVALALVLLVVFVGFEHLPHPADKNYFDRYYSYLGHGVGEFFKTLALSPWRVIERIGGRELLRYGLVVLLPWLFMPVAALRYARREALWLWALLPSFASAAIATYPPLRRPGFHYVLELWPVLAAVTLVVLARIPRGRSWAVAWALLALLAWDHDPLGDLREYSRGAAEAAPVRQLLAEIPIGNSVSADELSGPWLAGRLRVTRWPALDASGGRCPQWLALRGRDELEKARAICGGELKQEHAVGDWQLLRVLDR